MPRSLSVGMQAHLAGERHSRVLMLRLDTRYGASYAMTEHDLDIPFDIGDGEMTYYSNLAIFPSQLQLSVGFDADDIDIKGDLNSSFTRERIYGGYFADAEAYLFMVNWRDLTQGLIPLMRGFVTDLSLEDDQWKFTLSSEAAKYKLLRGRIVTPYDDNPNPTDDTPVAATVTAVTDNRNLEVSFSGTYATGYFNRGTIEFLSGPLVGGRRIEIATWADTGVIELWTRAPIIAEVGQTLNLRRPYPRTIEAFVARFGNADDFRGFPYLPGKDKFMQMATPEGSAPARRVGTRR